jgi:hypothetical protein
LPPAFSDTPFVSAKRTKYCRRRLIFLEIKEFPGKKHRNFVRLLPADFILS